MPRYYFDVCDNQVRMPDEEGTIYGNVDAAFRPRPARDLAKQFIDNC
jgi:hypothetical protein